MLIKEKDRPTEIRENVFGGKGTLIVRPYLTEKEITAPCRICAEVIVPPGSSTGVHQHDQEDEIYIIQRGHGIISDNGTDKPISPGDAVITGNGGTHAIHNTGTEDLVITAIVIRYK